ncbi:hypothetical protein AAE02nite_21480 [Adhaeribacter aerolatus]|uniref:Uncharacterized protein n=1 Tax=Adhaeribacter aerolatus TaxID=670289 RepID=A0A512AXQ2_9BACT|nr:hypothetical protein [Adhaeribacter aerolatus]GEO04484.1 hypothetical protein AAE02nite_21480 [Adhaeribacter aerolatus]
MPDYKLEYSEEQGKFHQDHAEKRKAQGYLTLCDSMDSQLQYDFMEAMFKKYPALEVGFRMKDEYPSFEQIQQEFRAFFPGLKN